MVEECGACGAGGFGALFEGGDVCVDRLDHVHDPTLLGWGREEHWVGQQFLLRDVLHRRPV